MKEFIIGKEGTEIPYTVDKDESQQTTCAHHH